MKKQRTNQQRVNYDKIAHLYDSGPHRGKEVDPNLVAFVKERGETAVSLRILDMGCGTGNQLVANQKQFPEAEFVGLDLFMGMLRQGQNKNEVVQWIRGDNGFAPFTDASFDYVSNQFSFHHVLTQAEMLRGVYRVLRKNGRFVMHNIAPREMKGWELYHYFPATYGRDLKDFPSLVDIQAQLKAIGFINVIIERNHFSYDVNLFDFLTLAQDRFAASQCDTLNDEEYQKGIMTIEADIAWGQNSFVSEICLITLKADKV